MLRWIYQCFSAVFLGAAMVIAVGVFQAKAYGHGSACYPTFCGPVNYYVCNTFCGGGCLCIAGSGCTSTECGCWCVDQCHSPC
jgi:hypothetical protein